MDRLGRMGRNASGHIRTGRPWLESIAAKKHPMDLVWLKQTLNSRVLAGKSILSRERFIIINEGLKKRLTSRVLSAEDKNWLDKLRASIMRRQAERGCSNEDKVRGNVLLQKIEVLQANFGKNRRDI